MPISRFLEDLVREGNLDSYMATLLDAFNPLAVDGLMCRTTLSVGWDGRLFDCDFNQMLELPLADGLPRHIRDFDGAASRGPSGHRGAALLRLHGGRGIELSRGRRGWATWERWAIGGGSCARTFDNPMIRHHRAPEPPPSFSTLHYRRDIIRDLG